MGLEVAGTAEVVHVCDGNCLAQYGNSLGKPHNERMLWSRKIVLRRESSSFNAFCIAFQ